MSDFKMENAMIYPYGIEFAPVLRHRHLMSGYKINSAVAPKGWGLCGKDAGRADLGEDIGICVGDSFLKGLDECDTVIIADCNAAEDYKQKITEYMALAIEKGKNLYCTLPLSNETIEFFKAESLKKGVYFKYFKEYHEPDKYSAIGFINEFDEKINNINVPVVFVGGITEKTNKFEIQLVLRDGLENRGFRVSQIGTRPYCELLGFHSFPAFMAGKHITEAEKIVSFNRMVKKIESLEKPDVIIVGIPGGLMPFSRRFTNGFGITAYEVSQAVRPDFSVVSVLYDAFSMEFFNGLNMSFRYKFGFAADCLNMGNFGFDPVFSKETGKMHYRLFDSERVDVQIVEYREPEMPVFNVLNKNDASKMVEFMIETLADYGRKELISENDVEVIL